VKFEKVISPNIPESDDENTEPPPLEDVPSHVSVDLTINTDDETDVENEESEFEKSDEICDTESAGSIRGENDAENTDTDAPKEVNDIYTCFYDLFYGQSVILGVEILKLLKIISLIKYKIL